MNKIILLGSLFILLFSVSLLWADEEIQIKIEDGIPVVYNPVQPIPSFDTKTRLVLEEELSIGISGNEYFFSESPEFISTAIDKEWNIYTLDPRRLEIRKFSNNGELIKIFRRKSGDQFEIKLPSSIRITPQKELMYLERMNNQLVFLTLDGAYLRSISAAGMRLRRIKVDSGGNLVADVYKFSQDSEGRTRVAFEIIRFDNKLEPQLTIFSTDITDEVKQNRYDPIYYWQITEDDNVILGKTENYEFSVINPKGKIIKKIRKEFVPVTFTEGEEDPYGRPPKAMRKEADSQKYHASGFYYFTLDEEGKIFTRTWEKTKDKMGYFYDVFDSEGRYIAKIPICAFIKIWKNGKVLAVEKNEDGFAVVKLFRVIWKLP